LYGRFTSIVPLHSNQCEGRFTTTHSTIYNNFNNNNNPTELSSTKASSRRKGSRRQKKVHPHGIDHDHNKHSILQPDVALGNHHHHYHQPNNMLQMNDREHGHHHPTTTETTASKTTTTTMHHHSSEQGPKSNPVSKFLSSIITPSQSKTSLVSSTPEWKALEKHAEYIQTTHLRNLLQDTERCNTMFATHDGVYLDYSRQRVNLETMDLLYKIAEKQQLQKKIMDMVSGEKINWTEDRAVLHTALRAGRPSPDTPQSERIVVDGEDVMEEVWDVLDQIKYFTEAVRSGEIRGFTGKRLRNIISVGIGGSYLGPEFLHECLKTEPEGINKSLGYTLRFLSNVDPVDVERACADLDPEETLVVVVSKTFTTAETMLNARTMRQWLWDFMGDDKEVVRKHVVAVASISSLDKVKAFGVDIDKYFFRFWDWVGGRYSVCSAVGGVPIGLLYGYDLFEKFLLGARSIDEHFTTAPFHKNIPVIMGLLGIWNMSFMGYKSRTTLPYSEALLKLPAHIQQLDMEVRIESIGVI
jgi:glucose-6-phosphate isomerase